MEYTPGSTPPAAIMQALTTVGVPRNLTYICSRLHSFSRNTFKLMSQNQASATNGSIITVDLPVNSLVDLSTLTMFANFSTTSTGGFAACPRGVEALVERLEVEINGTIVSGSCQFLNHLYQIIFDTTTGTDCANRRAILQNGGVSQAVPSANTTNQPIAMYNWLGFIGSVSPNILDTNILGQVRLRITLSNPGVLIQSANCAGPGFNLQNIFFSVDVVDLDPMFHQVHNDYLSRGGVYEIPFNNYFSYTSTGGLSQSTRFSLSSQSVNRAWGCFVNGAAFPINSVSAMGGSTSPAPGAYFEPNAQSSSYFARPCGGSLGGTVVSFGTAGAYVNYNYNMTSYQWQLNTTFMPNYQPTPEQAFALMMNSYQVSQQTDSGCSPLIKTLGVYTGSMWVCEARFDHGEGVTCISGIDTRGTNASGAWNTVGSIAQVAAAGALPANPGTNLTALVFLQTTSTLKVGQGRQIQVIL